jgi:transposase
MPFQRVKQTLVLSIPQREELERLLHSRTEPIQRVERAKMLLEYAAGVSVSAIARKLGTNRPKVYRCIDKALEVGVLSALQDLPGRGKKAQISEAAKAWVLSLACQKAKDLGYAQELWTTRLLAEHIRRHCRRAGHVSLSRIGRGTVSKILSGAQIKPHKVRYYVERRDPEFEAKMAQVLCVYKEVDLWRKTGSQKEPMVAILSYDEKPGIQALENCGQEKAPVVGQYPSWLRDYEYVRHGTLSLLAGIDLLNGHVHALVADRHRSREFIEFLRQVDQQYGEAIKIRLILDNHSAHISRETRRYLASVPNRFEFIFTPTHGSWLNLIETFFAKMARTFLRGLTVSSKAELKQRIKKYIEEVNQAPVISRWSYGLETVSVARHY